MLCRNQHSPTKNEKPPFRLPLHFTTSSIPPNHHLSHKLPQQKKRKKKTRKHDNPQILPPPLLPLSPPNPQRKGERLSSFQLLLHRLSRFQRPTHQSTLVSRCPSRFTDSRSDFSRTHHISRSRRRRRKRKKRTRQKVYYYTTTSSSFYRSRSENGVRIFLLFSLLSSSVISFLFSHHFFSSFLGKQNRWKNPHNIFRTQWNIHNVPVLVRYELVGENTATTTKQVKEVGRLVEGEILDERRLQELVYG